MMLECWLALHLPHLYKKILTSKPVKGEEAHDLGLVDATVSLDELINTARQWALDILEAKGPWVKSLYKTDKIEPLGEAREILKFARTQARKQAPNLEHPIVVGQSSLLTITMNANSWHSYIGLIGSLLACTSMIFLRAAAVRSSMSSLATPYGYLPQFSVLQ
ncbi:hypothetical protein HYC85_006288 [Camellia sinensis]|uniref:Uncharacterized protein n=1 Tax=Camellia sinensis TaxID=4442 RepID=A0A7J7HKK2_CAMSI|nr:hypothetical protein HYC85_006288 [Camellia sinensis]